MPPIRSLLMTAQLKTEQFEAGAKKVQGSLREIRTTTTQVQGSISGMGSALVGFGASAAGAVISFNALKSGIEGVVQAGVRMQSLQVAFKQVAGSAEAGRKEFGFVSDTANRLGQNVETLAKGYNSLAAASKGTTLEGQATKDIFLAVTQAGRSLQLSQEQVGGALTAVQQMMSKGTVASEELRGQLSERLPGAFQIAARAMGVTTAELGKMLEAGTVMSDVFLPKFAAQLRKELGQTTQEVTHTAAEQFARFGNAMTIVADNLAKNTGLLDWLGKVAGKIADIAIEADKANKRLDELGKKRAQEDIQSATRGAGATDTPENRRRTKELETINKQIDDAEAAIRRLTALKAKEPVEGSEVTKRLDAEIRREQRMLADLRTEKGKIAGTVTRTSQPNPMEEVVVGEIGDDAFIRKQNEEAERQKKLVAALEEVAKEAQKIYDITLATGGAFEAATARAKFLDEELKKIAKTAPDITTALAGGSGKYAAPSAIGERIRSHAAQQGVDPVLMEALISYESGFNPKATSPAGAKGLMQIMPQNYPSLGITDPYDVEQNLRGGMKLFRQLLDAFQGDVKLALTAYHSGPGKAKSGDLGPEGLKYAPSVLAREASLKGTGAAPNTPAQAKFAELLAWQKDAERIGTDNKAITKMTTDADKAAADALDQRTESYLRLAQSLQGGRKELSEYETAEIRTTISTLDADSATRRMIESMLTDIDVRRDVTAALKTEAVEQERLGEARKKVTDDYAKAMKQQEAADESYAKQKLVWQAEISSNAIAANEEIAASQKELGKVTLDIFDAMGEALKGGEDAWIRFAETVSRMVLKMAMDKSNFEQKLGDWIQTGVGWAMKLAGAAAGASSVDLPAGDVGGSVDFGSVGMAAGGPVTAGKAYVVGEDGPEILRMGGTSGTILNNSASNAYIAGAQSMANAYSASHANMTNTSNNIVQGDKPVTVVFNISTPDTGGFQKSRAEIARSMTQALQAAQRST